MQGLPDGTCNIRNCINEGAKHIGDAVDEILHEVTSPRAVELIHHCDVHSIHGVGNRIMHTVEPVANAVFDVVPDRQHSGLYLIHRIPNDIRHRLPSAGEVVLTGCGDFLCVLGLKKGGRCGIIDFLGN